VDVAIHLKAAAGGVDEGRQFSNESGERIGVELLLSVAQRFRRMRVDFDE
jgi:hypothetical protein